MDTSGPYPIILDGDRVSLVPEYTRLMAEKLNKRTGPWLPLPFIGAWTNFGGTAYEAGMYRLNGDRVELKGLIKGPMGSMICTFPEGYRPLQRHMTAMGTGAVGSVNGPYSLDVFANGNMRVAGTATMAYMSLTGLWFPIT